MFHLKQWLRRLFRRDQPYYRSHPDDRHGIVFRIDEHEFFYKVPGETGGWKDLVRTVNEIEEGIESGKLDTRISE